MSEYLSFYVQRYFMSYLMKQHNYGSNTISSYRDTFRLLLAFMAESNADISKIDEYSGLGVHAVRWLGNRLAII